MPDLLLKKEPLSETLRGTGSSLLFFAALGLFLVILASYGGLALLSRAQRNAEAIQEEQVKSKGEYARPELIRQILVLDERLNSMRILLTKHVFLSNTLRLVEASTHPQVRFTNFGVSAEGKRIELTGEAASYAVLTRQIGFFENDRNVERVEFGGLSLGGESGTLGFKLTVIFKPALLQIRPPDL